VFERFTERARQVVALAQDEARTLGHNHIGTEHLLLGVIREGGVAAKALEAGGLSLESTREAVVKPAGGGAAPARIYRVGDPAPVSGPIRFTATANGALQTGSREAIRLKAVWVTPQLVLLGVMMKQAGTSACVLRDCGVDTDAVIAGLGLTGQVDPSSVRPDHDASPEPRPALPPVVPMSSPGGESASGSSVLSRFTERARHAIVLAQNEAHGLKHNYVGVEHLLLGLLGEGEGLAARVLVSLDITAEEVRAEVRQIVGVGDDVVEGAIPFTPRTKRVLDLALREALALGHNYVGTEHILLALVRENEGVAARILLGFGADPVTIRGGIVDMISGPGRRGRAAARSVSRMSSSVAPAVPGPAPGLADTTNEMVVGFYDDFAADYHLVYGGNWESAVERQGKVLDALIQAELSGARSVLDCSCGIGTQAIGLARRGYRVVGTDISKRAIERARREARRLGTEASFAFADFRDLSRIDGEFDVVISCDNAVPHLLDADDVPKALGQMRGKLRPGGLLVITMRDFDAALMEKPPTTLPIIVAGPPRRVLVRLADWDEDQPCYTVRFLVLTDREDGWELTEHTTRYRAITRNELSTAATTAGFAESHWQTDRTIVGSQQVLTAINTQIAP
jgi:SAM-dependent methyltransferase